MAVTVHHDLHVVRRSVDRQQVQRWCGPGRLGPGESDHRGRVELLGDNRRPVQVVELGNGLAFDHDPSGFCRLISRCTRAISAASKCSRGRTCTTRRHASPPASGRIRVRPASSSSRTRPDPAGPPGESGDFPRASRGDHELPRPGPSPVNPLGVTSSSADSAEIELSDHASPLTMPAPTHPANGTAPQRIRSLPRLDGPIRCDILVRTRSRIIARSGPASAWGYAMKPMHSNSWMQAQVGQNTGE